MSQEVITDASVLEAQKTVLRSEFDEISATKAPDRYPSLNRIAGEITRLNITICVAEGSVSQEVADRLLEVHDRHTY